MKKDDFMQALNGVDDALVEDAHAARRSRRVLPKVLIAAAAAAALTITAAATGLLGVRLFTDSEEAQKAMDQQLAQTGSGTMWWRDSAPHYTAEEAAEAMKETADRTVELVWRGEQNIRDDTSGGATWNRRMTYDGGYYFAADELTTLVQNDPSFCADFSYLDTVATPVAGTVYLYRQKAPLCPEPKEDEWTHQAFCNATYLTSDGGVLSVGISAHEGTGVGLDSVLAESYAFDEEIKSADGVVFRLFGTGDGRVDAKATDGTVRIWFTGWDGERETVQDIIEHCSFAEMIKALNAELLIVE